MRKIFLLTLLLFPFTVFSQAPDLEAIARNITDQGSQYYYPNLMNRYLAADSTLTLSDYRHLYYGFIFSEGYDAAKTARFPREMQVFEDKGIPIPDDYKRVIAALEKSLRIDPFNLQFLNFLTFCYNGAGDTARAALSSARFRNVIGAILSSGTGVSENFPYYVIYFTHPEDVMTYLGKKTGKPELLSTTKLYIPLLVREGGVAGYYFELFVKK